MMTPDRKPWLFLKRVNSWNPWGPMREQLVPRAEGRGQERCKKGGPRWV